MKGSGDGEAEESSRGRGRERASETGREESVNGVFYTEDS